MWELEPRTIRGLNRKIIQLTYEDTRGKTVRSAA
jgi:hypothetical protein